MRITADDYVEIMQLYARFMQGVDLDDSAMYANTFTEDGWFEGKNLPGGAPAAGRTVGRPALKGMVEALQVGLAGHCRHFVSPTSMLIEGDEHGARIRGYMYELRAGTVPNTGVYLTGLYDDRLVKVDGAWLFASRSVAMDPQPDAGTPTDVLVTRFDELYPRA